MRLTNLRPKQVISSLFCAVYAVTLGFGLFHPSVVLAAGETYTWKNFQTITVSGGVLTKQGDLILGLGTLPGQAQRFTGSLPAKGKFPNGKTLDCLISLSLTLNNNSSGALSATGFGIGANGSVPECPSSVESGFNNTTVSIGGARPGDNNDSDERPDQKSVSVTVNSPLLASQSPDTINITLTNSSGSVTVLTLHKSVVAPPNDDEAYYFANTQLEAGTYTVATDAFNGQIAPVSFLKEKFKPGKLVFGAGFGASKVYATVKVDLERQQGDFTISPISLVIMKADGTVVATASTRPFVEKQTSSSKNGLGGAQTGTLTFTPDVQFPSVPPGDYNLCMESDKTTCASFTKGPGFAHVTLDITGSSALALPDGVKFPSKDGDDSNANPSFSCENKLGFKDVVGVAVAPLTGGASALPAIGKSMNWIVCTIIRAINGAINILDGFIQQELQFNSSKLEDGASPGQPSGYFQAWSAFRYLSVGLLVLIGLLMVISQLIGVGIFDAYTVKKLLPRILVAAILITLSWTLCKIIIDAVNIIGGAVRSLIYAPFGGSEQIGKDISNALNNKSGGTADAAFAGAAVGGYFLLGTTNFLVILSFAVPALFAVLLGFFFVIMRQVVIVLAVIMAPLAVVGYILPGTEKIWKLWRETFIRGLLMYPLIVAFLSIGRVFAAVTVRAGTGATSGGININIIIAMIAYFGPYFAIPATFKFAGGLLNTFTGMVNDRSKGLLDRAKKGRQNQQAKTWARTRGFSRFNDKTALGRAASTFMGGAAAGPKHWRPGGIAAAKETQMALYGAGEFEKNQVMKLNKNNDKFLLAHADRARAITERDTARASGNTAAAAAWQQAINLADQAPQTAGARLASAQALAATGYQLARGQTGYNQLAEMMATHTGVQLTRDAAGNVVGATGANVGMYAQAMNSAQYGLKNAMRFDLAGINDGKGYDVSKGLGKASLYELGNGKPEGIEAMYSDLPPGMSVDHAVAYQELKAMLPSSKGAARDKINAGISQLESAGVEAFMRTSTGNPRTVTTRYDSRVAAHGAWTPAEKAQGYKIETVGVETFGDIAEKQARTYERPDPNRI